jgi:hypothetical protein
MPSLPMPPALGPLIESAYRGDSARAGETRLFPEPEGQHLSMAVLEKPLT